MRNLLLLLACITITTARSQNNVGIGTPTPDISSILELNSNTKGFLGPRMTTAERLAIVTPAAGLLVYDINVGCYFLYNGAWLSLCATSPVCNTATTGNVALFSSPTSVCNSVLFQSGNNIGLNTTTPAVSFQVNTTDAIGLPTGTTAQQPVGAPLGSVRYNTTLGVVEVYSGTCWQNVNTPPIGSTYVQWFNAADPNTIYPCTQWVSSDIANGEFIRARGGSSNVVVGGALTGTIQTNGVQDHTHTIAGVINGTGVLATSSDGSHNHTGSTSGAVTNSPNIWIPYDDNLSSDALNLSMSDNPSTCGSGWDGRHTAGNFMGRLSDGCMGHIHNITADGAHTHTIADHTHTFNLNVGNMNSGSIGTETRPDNVAVVFWRRVN